jgi:hypothetical protein
MPQYHGQKPSLYHDFNRDFLVVTSGQVRLYDSQAGRNRIVVLHFISVTLERLQSRFTTHIPASSHNCLNR